MGQKFRNNFTTTLTATITTSSTSLSLTAAPSPAITLSESDDYFLLTIINTSGVKEVVKCVGISGLTVTIGTTLGTPSVAGRAQEGTSALAITHTDGHAIAMRATRGTLESILSAIDVLEAATAIASEVQAETGTDNTYPLSSLRGRQMMDGYAPVASEVQAETGENNTARMTPLRTAQANAAQTKLSNDSSPSLAGDLTQGEYITYLNSALSADGTASGKGFTGTVDSNSQGFGAPLFCAADGNYEACDADLEGSMPCRCLALETGTGEGKKLLLKGFIRNDAWSWTMGANIYVSTATGSLTQTLVDGTDDQAQVVGFAVTANSMYFNPNDVMVEII